MEAGPAPEAAADAVHTYHCICHTLLLAIYRPLDSLPMRSSSKDNARILGPAIQSQVVHVITDPKPVIIRREDGFEKRTLIRCERCQLAVAYSLDGDHFDATQRNIGEQTLYLLPGSLVDTKGMKTGQTPEIPSWARETD